VSDKLIFYAKCTVYCIFILTTVGAVHRLAYLIVLYIIMYISIIFAIWVLQFELPNSIRGL